MPGPHTPIRRGNTQRPSPLRKTTARCLPTSPQTSVQPTTVAKTDVTPRRRTAQPARRATEVTPALLPFPASAAKDVLRRTPVINASLNDAGPSASHRGHQHLAVVFETTQRLAHAAEFAALLDGARVKAVS